MTGRCGFASISHFTNKFDPEAFKADASTLEWYLEEKVDGSQISFCIHEGKIEFYNKGKQIKLPKVFQNTIFAISTIASKLNPNFSYHGESICKVRHNVVHYDRVPAYYFVLFDIREVATKLHLPLNERNEEAKRLGFETVQLLHPPTLLSDASPFHIAKGVIERIGMGECESMLGGKQIEGVVFKLNNTITKKRSATLKMVAPLFKEFQSAKKVRLTNVTHDEWISEMGKRFDKEPRFHKAVQHLLERGVISEPVHFKHSSMLVRELDEDLMKEFGDELMAMTWARFGPLIIEYARSSFGDWFATTFAENNAAMSLNKDKKKLKNSKTNNPPTSDNNNNNNNNDNNNNDNEDGNSNISNAAENGDDKQAVNENVESNCENQINNDNNNNNIEERTTEDECA